MAKYFVTVEMELDDLATAAEFLATNEDYIKYFEIQDDSKEEYEDVDEVDVEDDDDDDGGDVEDDDDDGGEEIY